MPATNLALVIRPDATFGIIDWPDGTHTNLATLYAAIGCTNVDVVDLSPEASMWLDDDGINVQAPVNIPATQLYAVTNGRLHQLYYGTAVITGGTNRQGDTIGLTHDQCEMLRGIAGAEITAIPHQRTK